MSMVNGEIDIRIATKRITLAPPPPSGVFARGTTGEGEPTSAGRTGLGADSSTVMRQPSVSVA
jgi:hypothetical protein